jgi:cellulose synthase/poly-beta-1,6-N-acetylglucosamine synthase-like glycosyltransferase
VHAGDHADDAYARRARRLGLSFATAIRLDPGAMVDMEAIRRGTFAKSPGAAGLAFVAPEEETLPDIAHWLARYPAARQRLCVTTPTAIRSALMRAGAARFAVNAVNRLAILYPDLSARRVVTGRQLVAGLGLAAAVAFAFFAAPVPTVIALNLIGAFFFFGVSVLRFIAAGFVSRRKLGDIDTLHDGTDDDLPVYTILVPLLHEAHLVPDLVAALGRLDWPRERLDIKLIVEADDPGTVAAAETWGGAPPFEVVVVPAGQPRTKPKALSFALPFARGEFVTVYDAEDRPHPQQLRMAHATFLRSPHEIVCLQATLAVDHGDSSLLAGLFAIEYAALFDGLLPMLAALDMPLPLGGTSNHFRREALAEVGGWDPFNVTEDADLGLRLARFGYRSGTIDLQTFEEAPATLWPWIRQRTRWFKGWMQTWLVHTRQPLRLLHELGWRRFLGFNLIGTGLIVSALIHPIYLATLVLMATDPLTLWGDGGAFAAMVVGVNLFNLFAGYTAMAALATRTLDLRGNRRGAWALVLLPVYWLLMSVASYRALFHLVARPHKWEKTPHRGRTSEGARALW